MLHALTKSAPMIGSNRLQWYCCLDCDARGRAARITAKRASKRAERQRARAAARSMKHYR